MGCAEDVWLREGGGSQTTLTNPSSASSHLERAQAKERGGRAYLGIKPLLLMEPSSSNHNVAGEGKLVPANLGLWKGYLSGGKFSCERVHCTLIHLTRYVYTTETFDAVVGAQRAARGGTA